MANMSYCRFQNTQRDLMDCVYELQDADDNEVSLDEFLDSLSKDESRALIRMIDAMQNVLEVVESMSNRNTNS